MNPNQLWPASFQQQFTKYTGSTRALPGDARLRKLSFLLSEGSTLDIGGDYRTESDIRDFGNQVSYESASNIKNSTGAARAKWTAIFGAT